ncbi:uncharacterized protein EHS24_002936 [Apiotrichum porosum]|uniref:SAP domain-containing protein n=1 Tax=Apiotrichum porosum TaxID=105984 RepID=A0A427XG46_9TREE|nr:uncharacterized protein EHS24_002936 [Apiotrichum porosum]RSH77870.1 hypothetical protein EHS24_002936 [Apiotrichum porosum]
MNDSTDRPYTQTNGHGHDSEAAQRTLPQVLPQAPAPSSLASAQPPSLPAWAMTEIERANAYVLETKALAEAAALAAASVQRPSKKAKVSELKTQCEALKLDATGKKDTLYK